MKLSANTARWLAQNAPIPEDSRNRLRQVVETVHGSAVTDDQVQLIEAKHSEIDVASVAAKRTVENPRDM